MPSVPIVSYEEMEQSKLAYQEAWIKYNHTYFNFLTTVLKEAGVYKKLVNVKKFDLQGQFKVTDNPYTSQPWRIAFFPVKKVNGGISSKTKYLGNFNSWRDDTLVQQLKDIAEVVGDLP